MNNTPSWDRLGISTATGIYMKIIVSLLLALARRDCLAFLQGKLLPINNEIQIWLAATFIPRTPAILSPRKVSVISFLEKEIGGTVPSLALGELRQC